MRYDPQNEHECPACGVCYTGHRRNHECAEPVPAEDDESEET